MVGSDVVLLIGDSCELAGVVARLLEPFGARYQLCTVGNSGAQAYLQGDGKYTDRTQYPLPDLVLLDLNMPSNHGIEVLEWIRRQRQFNDVPVAVLAEPSEIRQASRGYETGANAFLTKPPAFGELRDVLLALQSQQTGEPEAPDTADIGAPMVVVKSQFMELREAFEQAGFPSRIETLEDIESAKAHLKKQATGKGKGELPLFVDLDLGEGAFELIEWARRDLCRTGSRIIVLCKPGDIQGLSRAADSGAELFIVKPVTAKKLSQIRERISDTWKEEIPRESERDTAATEAINLSRRGILYVAGNPSDFHLFSTAMSQGAASFPIEFLESFADVVECVRHKGESRRIVSASPCCLLLDDATVGEASGEIVRWIRNQSSFPELSIVMFSDIDDPVIVKSIYSAGADYYLVKPKSFEGLLSIVNILDLGSRQVPPGFADFARLPEYRDRLGNPATPGAAGVQYAE